MDETLPAQATDAEESLLGAAMSGYPHLDDLLDIVEPADFYRPLNQEIWAAIGRVHHAGNQPDPISVRVALSVNPPKGFDPIRLLDMVGRQSLLVTQAPYYAELVATTGGMRRIQAAAVKISRIASTPGDLADKREQVRQEIDQATQGRDTRRARTLGDALPEVLDIAQHGQAAMLPTGWADLDRLIGGLAPGRLVVVGARPGVGKSLMGTNLALTFAHRHDHAVLVASLEMPESEVVQRLLACHARVNLTNLQNGTTDDASWNRIAAQHARLAELPITIDDSPSQTVTHIRRRARDVQRQRDDLALIVVDYLQLVATPGATDNRAQALGEVSRGLKLLARETGSCVVAMAQLNRESAKHGGGVPKSADLRESGSIEADADQVILLHQPDDEIPELTVIVDKNRHGPKGQATLLVEGHYASLQSIAWNPSRGIA